AEEIDAGAVASGEAGELAVLVAAAGAEAGDAEAGRDPEGIANVVVAAEGDGGLRARLVGALVNGRLEVEEPEQALGGGGAEPQIERAAGAGEALAPGEAKEDRGPGADADGEALAAVAGLGGRRAAEDRTGGG